MQLSLQMVKMYTLAQAGGLWSKRSFFAQVRRISQSLILKVLPALPQRVVCSPPDTSMVFMCARREESHAFTLIVGNGNLSPAHAVSVL